MVDIFALALPHALLVLALFRIMTRDDLDREDEAPNLDDVPPQGGVQHPAATIATGRPVIRRGVRVRD